MHTLNLKERVRKQKIRTLKGYFGEEAVVLGLSLGLMIALGMMASNNIIPTEMILLATFMDAVTMLVAFVAIGSGVYNLKSFMFVWEVLSAMEEQVNR